MNAEQTFEVIAVESLLDRVRAMRDQGYRLVQIGATNLGEQLELNYTFDRDRSMTNLRLQVPAVDGRIPSISSLYWCAFIYENEIHDLFKLNVEAMAVDFHGQFYRTAVQYAFGTTKLATPKVAPATTTVSHASQSASGPGGDGITVRVE